MVTPTLRTRLVAVTAALACLPLALVGAAVAVNPAAAQKPAGVPSDADLQARLDAAVSAGASGMVLLADDGRTSRSFVSGAARLEPWIPMYAGARLRVGSVTKTFLATLVLQAVGERRLRLSDSVEHWLPGLVPDGEDITVRQLLNQTSGLFDIQDDEDFFHAVLSDPLREYAPEQLIGIATAHPPVFDPGEGWGYSNTNYLLLGLIVERATHQSVSTLIRQRITEPLSLDHTYLPVRSPDLPPFHVHGYLPPSMTGAGYVDFTRVSPTAFGSAGALVSTPDDLRRFYRALLSGRLLRPMQLAQMRRTVRAGPGYDYGMGLYTRMTPCGRIWGHDGNVPGYEVTAWNDTTGRRGFVLAVTTQPDDAIQQAEDEAITAATCRVLGRPVPTR